MEKLPELSKVQWTELVERLSLYAHRKLARLYWRGVQGRQGGKAPGGIEPADLASEAIVDLIEGNRVWNQEAETDLLKFLQGVVDSKVSHLVESRENRVTRRLTPNRTNKTELTAYDLADKNPSPAVAAIHKESLQAFQAKVRKAVEADDLALRVFECLEADITKPAEMAEVLGVDVNEIYSARKRLNRKVGNALMACRKGMDHE